MASMDKFESGLSMWQEYEVPELEDFLHDNELLDEQAMWREVYDPTGQEKDIFEYSMPSEDFERYGRPTNYPDQPEFVWAFNASGKYYAFPVAELSVAYAAASALPEQSLVPYTDQGTYGTLDQPIVAATAPLGGYFVRNIAFSTENDMSNRSEGDILGVYI